MQIQWPGGDVCGVELWDSATLHGAPTGLGTCEPTGNYVCDSRLVPIECRKTLHLSTREKSITSEERAREYMIEEILGHIFEHRTDVMMARIPRKRKQRLGSYE